MKNYAVKAESSYRIDCLSNDYNDCLDMAGARAKDYLDFGGCDVSDLSNEDAVDLLNWEIVEVSEDLYDFLMNTDWSTYSSNYVNPSYAKHAQAHIVY